MSAALAPHRGRSGTPYLLLPMTDDLIVRAPCVAQSDVLVPVPSTYSRSSLPSRRCGCAWRRPRRFKRVESATTVIWKTLLIAENTPRRLDAPELLADVASGDLHQWPTGYEPPREEGRRLSDLTDGGTEDGTALPGL